MFIYNFLNIIKINNNKQDNEIKSVGTKYINQIKLLEYKQNISKQKLDDKLKLIYDELKIKIQN